MKPSLDISRIEEYQRAFAADRKWEQYHTLKNLAASISIESAELQEIFQWLTDEEVSTVMSEPKKAAGIKNEVADIFYYLVRFCDVAGIDLEQAFWEKTRENEEKYPAEKARGNAKKYDEFED